MFKKIFSVALVLLLSGAGFTMSTEAKGLEVNGHTLDCHLENGITYASVREFTELYDGYSISWEGKSKTATVKGNGLNMTVTQGKEYSEANGRVLVRNGKNKNISGRLYAPITVLAKAFSATVSWDAKTRTAYVTGGGGAIASAESYYDGEELYWLSRIINAESRGESLMGKCAVGNVVLNRRTSHLFPNSIYGVIFDTRYGVQFSPVSDGSIYLEPEKESIIAAKAVLDGFTMSEDILYFMNPRTAQSNWISKNRPYAFTLGNHDFYN